MAALMGIGPFLPVFAVGGVAVLLYQQRGATAPDEYEPTEDDRRRKEMMTELEHGGASASVFDVLVNKAFRMGANLNGEYQLDVSGGGYNPDRSVNPLRSMMVQQADMVDFDRQDTFYSLVSQQGEIRPRTSGPILALLTPEIHRPGHPDQVTDASMYRHVPTWANYSQTEIVKKNIGAKMQNSQNLMPHFNSQFFNRAPGQSFRYE